MDLLWGSAGKVFKFDGRQQAVVVSRNQMKLHLFVVFLFISAVTYSQTGKMRFTVTSTDSANNGDLPFVEIYHGAESIYHGYYQWNKPYLLDSLETGYYKVVVRVVAQKNKVFDSIYINSSSISKNAFGYPGPCLFSYKKGFLPTCWGGHKDHIVPIVYGYPSKHSMRLAKKGKIYLGGCIVSNCDPQYYCTVHKREL